jgi:hypothetical protein
LFADRQPWVKRGVLKDQASFRSGFGHRQPVERDTAFGGVFKARKDMQQRAFPASFAHVMSSFSGHERSMWAETENERPRHFACDSFGTPTIKAVRR